MFADFNREFADSRGNRIPDLVVQHLSEKLPKGLIYEQDTDGNLVVTSESGQAVIGGLKLLNSDEILEKVGQDATEAEIMQYAYNAQKALHFKSIREGYIKINGEDIPVDEIRINLFREIEKLGGRFTAIPPKFPDEVVSVNVSCEEYVRVLRVKRVPNDSLYVMAFKSPDNEPLQITLEYDGKSGNASMTLSLKLSNAKRIRDIVESIFIYNAFVDGKAYVDGERTPIPSADQTYKKFNEGIAEFWRRTLAVEDSLGDSLGISFVCPEELLPTTVANVEELYRSLVLKRPVHTKQHLTSIKGVARISDKFSIDDMVGVPMNYQYVAERQFNVLGARIDVVSVNEMINAVIERYERNDDKIAIFFRDDKSGNTTITSTINFLSREDMNDYLDQDEDQLNEWFEHADLLQDVVNEIIGD